MFNFKCYRTLSFFNLIFLVLMLFIIINSVFLLICTWKNLKKFKKKLAYVTVKALQTSKLALKRNDGHTFWKAINPGAAKLMAELLDKWRCISITDVRCKPVFVEEAWGAWNIVTIFEEAMENERAIDTDNVSCFCDACDAFWE